MTAFSFKNPKQQPKETTTPKECVTATNPTTIAGRKKLQTLDYDTSLNEVMFRKKC